LKIGQHLAKLEAKI